MAEGEKQRMILEAEGKAEKIFLKCKALAERLGLISESISEGDTKNGGLKLVLSETVFESMEELGKEGNHIVLGQNLADGGRVIDKNITNFERDVSLERDNKF